MTQVWRPIPGYEGYEASNMGQIKSLARQVNNNGGIREIPECVLSQWKVKSTGYLQADLSGRRIYAHRAVALAWCGGFFEGAHVDHVNGKRDDNRALNLEWVTASENSTRSFANGRLNPQKGKFSGDHSTSKAVLSRCINTGEVKRWQAAMDAVREGFDSSCISRCCSGQNKYHRGHEWRLATDGDRHGVEWTEKHLDERSAA